MKFGTEETWTKNMKNWPDISCFPRVNQKCLEMTSVQDFAPFTLELLGA